MKTKGPKVLALLISAAVCAFQPWTTNSAPRQADPEAFIAHDVFATYGRNPKAPLPESDPSKLPPPWPPNAQPNGYYVVSRPESVAKYPYVKLPNNFHLSLAPDVDHIQWEIDRLEFGTNVTFDTSRFLLYPVNGPPGFTHTPYPPAPPDQPSIPGEASPHQDGAKGLKGRPGDQGFAGRATSLLITNIIEQGSLWIHTDGNAGGLPGKGGNGQIGGDHECGDKPETAGNGGAGGDGGVGGAGGSTSVVTILIKSLPVGYMLHPEACSQSCGNSTRPPNANGDDGRIVVWGSPGCGGIVLPVWGFIVDLHAGAPGDGGAGGGGTVTLECHDFPWGSHTVKPGHKGPDGQLGSNGPKGNCGLVQFLGPSS